MENVNLENQQDNLQPENTAGQVPNAESSQVSSAENAPEETLEEIMQKLAENRAKAEAILPIEQEIPVGLESDVIESTEVESSDFESDTDLPTDEEDKLVEAAAHDLPHEVVSEITTEIVHDVLVNEAVLEATETVTDYTPTSSPADTLVAELASDGEDEVLEEDLPDFKHLDKEALLRHLKVQAQLGISNKVDAVVKRIKEAFESLNQAEKDLLLAKFVEEGGEEADFTYRYDELTKQFNTILSEYRNAFRTWKNNIEASREKNLETKKQLLDKLKELVDTATPSTNLNSLRTIQEEWKAAGAVPQAYVRDLNASYHVLVDRFFTNRAIFKELRDLDRQRNMESKLQLVERAEKLLGVESLAKAIAEFKDIQEEFNHVGAVPNKDDNDALYARMRTTADQLFEKRRTLMAAQQEVLQVNLVAKKALLDKAIELENYETTKISDWNAKSDELRALQTQWSEIGAVPDENIGTEMRRQFWASIKKFFRNKAKYFKTQDEERQKNRATKVALIEEAEQLATSEDWNATTNRMKELQEAWRKVGHVPQREQEALYERFKKAMDAFFEAKRNLSAAKDQELAKNAEAKHALIEEIELASDADANTMDALTDIMERYVTVGFVPRDDMRSIQNKLLKAVDNYLRNVETVSEFEKARFKLNYHITSGPAAGGNNNNRREGGGGNQRREGGGQNDRRDNNRRDNNRGGYNKGYARVDANDPAASLLQVEYDQKRKIEEMENQINLWQNNLEYFALSRNADTLKKDVQTRIDGLQKDLDKIRKEMKDNQQQIRTLRDLAKAESTEEK